MTSENHSQEKRALKHIADFEWASVGRYMAYISGVMELKEISSHRVVSFPLSRLGPVTVLKQKRATARTLQANICALEVFVGERKKELESEELVVLRGLYIQYKCNLDTVREHIRSAEFYRASVDVSMFEVVEEDEDEFPF